MANDLRERLEAKEFPTASPGILVDDAIAVFREWLESEAVAVQFLQASKQWAEPCETIRESGVIVEQGLSEEDCADINAMMVEDAMESLKALAAILEPEGTEDECAS